MNEPWVEKYRPRTFEDWVGDDETKTLISGFFDRWEIRDPINKVLILHGPPGIGKTSAIYAIAEDRGYVVREFNASESRTKSVLRKALTESLIRPVDGSIKIILLDEVEGTIISKAIDGLRPEWKKVATPIVITSNDVSGFPNTLLGRSLSLRLLPPSSKVRLSVLRRINQAENLGIPFIDLARVASKAKTIRSAIATLQMCVIVCDFVHIKAVDIPPGFSDHMLDYLNGRALRPTGMSTGLILRFFEENRLPPQDVINLNVLLRYSKNVAGLSEIADIYADMCSGDVKYLKFPKARADDTKSRKISHVKSEKKGQRKKKGRQKGKKNAKSLPQIKISSWGTYG